MPRLFISYSRVDRPFVDDLVPLVRDVWGYENVWFDENLYGGQIWWQEILQQISDCDIFVYLLSNESITSEYCQAEYQEAQRLQKQILPVQIRARTNIPAYISQYQYVDMSLGIKPQNLNKFHASVAKLSKKILASTSLPLETQPIPLPSVSDRKTDDIIKRLIRQVTCAMVAMFVIGGIVFISAVALVNQFNRPSNVTPTVQDLRSEQNSTNTSATAVALAPTDEPTATTEPSRTSEPLSPTFTSTSTDTVTDLPTATYTFVPTNTPVLPTETHTATNLPTATHTALQPTATYAPTELPTATYTATLTETPVPFTSTPVVPTATTTDTAEPTDTEIPSETPSPTLTETSIPRNTPTPTDDRTVAIVIVSSANLRSGPGTAYDVLRFVVRGTRLEIIARSRDIINSWYLVYVPGGGTAWIASSTVEVEPSNISPWGIEIAATIPPLPLTPTPEVPTAVLIRVERPESCQWVPYMRLTGFVPNSVIVISNNYIHSTCSDPTPRSSSWADTRGWLSTDATGSVTFGLVQDGWGTYNYTFEDQVGNSATLTVSYNNE